MIDSKRLRDAVKESGLKYKFIAKEMNLSAYGLQNKIDNGTEFKASEIDTISRILSLTPQERDVIFFSCEVTESQQSCIQDKEAG